MLRLHPRLNSVILGTFSGMRKSIPVVSTLVGITCVFWAASTLAELPVSAELIERVKQMSPGAKRALAAQYQVSVQDIEALVSNGAEPNTVMSDLGRTVDPLVQMTPRYPKIPEKPLEDDYVTAEAPGLRSRQFSEYRQALAEWEKNYGEAAKQELEAETDEGEIEEEIEPIDESLERFGSNIFDASISTFAPVDNIPVPKGYLLGVGDSLSISLYGNDNIDAQLIVDREGAINFPILGPIVIAGMRWGEALELIEQRVDDQLIGTSVVVSLGRLRSINVFIAGEVNSPGNYAVSALTTITQAIYVAGGITDDGSYRRIQVRRDGQTVAVFDLYDLLLSGSLSGDERLQSGDVLFVPVTGPQVEVRGEVYRSASFEIGKNETVADLLFMAGGLTNIALTTQALYEKRLPDNILPTLLNLDLKDPSVLSMALSDGDKLTVKGLPDRAANPVTLSGAFERPGIVAWSEGVRLSDFMGHPDRDLSEDVDYDIGLISRRINSKLDVKVTVFNPGKAIDESKSQADLLLEANDEVFVFDRSGDRTKILEPIVAKLESQASQKNWPQIIDLVGSMGGAGRYPLPSSNFHFSDLLTLAGGESFVNLNIDLDIGIIARREGSLTNIVTIPFSPKDSLNKPHGEGDPKLQRLDKIIVFNTDSDPLLPNRQELLGPLLQEMEKYAAVDKGPQMVSIQGRVREPGQYPLLAEGNLRSLIELAGGFDEGAYIESAEIQRRQVISGQRLEVAILKVDLKELGSNPIKLQSRDTIRINTIPGWFESSTVTIEGEVKFPGVYSVEPNEKLSGLIERAGGLTADAFAEGAVFTNERSKEIQRRQATNFVTQLSRQSSSRGQILDEAESDLDAAREMIEGALDGRVSIRLNDILTDAGNILDPVLEDGDALFVPKRAYTVGVLGEVFQPGTLGFDEDINARDYIELAGGLTRFADLKRAYIIKANGDVTPLRKRSWLLRRPDQSVREGDVVVVPTNLDYEKALTRVQSVTNVLFQTMTSIAAFFSITNN